MAITRIAPCDETGAIAVPHGRNHARCRAGLRDERRQAFGNSRFIRQLALLHRWQPCSRDGWRLGRCRRNLETLDASTGGHGPGDRNGHGRVAPHADASIDREPAFELDTLPQHALLGAELLANLFAEALEAGGTAHGGPQLLTEALPDRLDVTGKKKCSQRATVRQPIAAWVSSDGLRPCGGALQTDQAPQQDPHDHLGRMVHFTSSFAAPGTSLMSAFRCSR